METAPVEGSTENAIRTKRVVLNYCTAQLGLVWFKRQPCKCTRCRPSSQALQILCLRMA